MAGKQKQALNEYSLVENAMNDFHKGLKELADYKVKCANEINEQNNIQYKKTVTLFLILLIVALIISMLVTIIISRNITIPLEGCVSYFKLLAKGDFSIEIKETYRNRKDEIGELAIATELMGESIKILVREVKDEAYSIENVNKNVIDLNSDIEEVSATTQELSAAMEETAASADKVAETSQEIERAVQSIAEKAQDGAVEAGKINERAENTKQSVKASQKKTDEILKKSKFQLGEAIQNSKVFQ